MKELILLVIAAILFMDAIEACVSAAKSFSLSKPWNGIGLLFIGIGFIFLAAFSIILSEEVK